MDKKRQKRIMVAFTVTLLTITGYFVYRHLYWSSLLYPPEIIHVLKQAGSNRCELEKVLAYYSADRSDSLKYKAACFLIENMPDHYELYHKTLDSLRCYLLRNKIDMRVMTDFTDQYGSLPTRFQKKPDILHITSDYLIRNIEFSFKVWHESPWGKTVSFDDFCEEILPYRVSNEPVENWKETYYQIFYPLIDSLVGQNNLDEVCKRLCKTIKPDYNQGWVADSKLSVPGLGALTLLKSRFGSCQEEAEMIVYILRSLGIPTSIDMILQHVDHTVSKHYWNYIRNLNGQQGYIESFTYSNTLNFSPDRKYGKIYRRRYACQEESLPIKYKNKMIPKFFNELLWLQDVSNEYFPNMHISVWLDSKLIREKEIIYLNVYNGYAWIPVAWSEKENKTVVFRHVEPDILYRLSIFSKGKNIAVSEPFIFKGYGTFFPQADTTQLQDMALMRKYKLKSRWNIQRANAIGGRFQGAQLPDFSDSEDLYVITDSTTLLWTNVPVDHPKRFRYVRYLSSDNGHNNMAEMQFLSDGVPLKGTVIGTEGSWKNTPGYEKEKTFDGDPLTFFDSPEPQGDWAGLAFDTPQKIELIRYLYRNDDNNVRTGDLYELFYWDRGNWISFDKRVADTTVLFYKQVPSETLYWLHNHTRGKEERPFTYENGQQIWY
ncbi:MAG: hypothetical protein LBG96_11635 [Tannerella sp.]|jgi:hypothetical protein|nr:hypothetical protein [Tannerella sp.]